MRKINLFRTLIILAVVLFFFAGIVAADGEWSTSGNNIFNTNSGAVNINNPTGPSPHPLNVGSTGGSNIRLTGRDNVGQDEAAIMFQKYDGSTFHGLIQGIGGKLQFLGSSGTGLTVDSAGSIGIGTTTPAAKLQVVGGGIKVAGASEFYDTVALLGTAPYLFIGSSSGAGQYGYLWWDDTNKLVKLAQQSSGGLGLVVNNVGNVGIGTTNPQSALAVNGTITAKKVKVTEVGWSDFVFADDYMLPSLAAVEDHIKKHKHLPGIPSAAEIGQKGLDVSDVLAKQMQKIEELTLYVIELQKQIEELKKK